MKTIFFPILLLMVFSGMVMTQRCEYVPDDTPSGIDTTDTVVVDVPRDTLSVVSYIPMLVPGNQWNEVNGGDFAHREKTYITKLGQQKMINGLTYYQLLIARDSLSLVWEPNGYAREDTVEYKVYYMQENQPEVLLYAFNVKSGDIWESYDVRYGNKIVITVTAVDSVVIDYKWHQVLQILSSTEPDQNGQVSSRSHKWIEGIGDIEMGWFLGNLSKPIDGAPRIFLLCFHRNGELVYKPETKYDGCFVWLPNI
jgi:hypothetical protein